MFDSDMSTIVFLLTIVLALFLFPGGPGTPLAMRAAPERKPF